MIQIKSIFGKWHEVSREQAKRFALCFTRIYDPKVYNAHIKGITYEELMK